MQLMKLTLRMLFKFLYMTVMRAKEVRGNSVIILTCPGQRLCSLFKCLSYSR